MKRYNDVSFIFGAKPNTDVVVVVVMKIPTVSEYRPNEQADRL